MKSSSETEVIEELYMLHYDPFSAFVILIFHIEQGRLFHPPVKLANTPLAASSTLLILIVNYYF